MTYILMYKMILLLMMLPVLSLADDGSIQKDNLHQGNNLHYTLTAEGAVGTGDYTAYYLTANRHGILSTNSNTGYVRTALQYNHSKGKWDIETGLDIEAQSHSYNNFFIQQFYSQATYSWISLGFGAKEFSPVLRDIRLSSGSTIWSGNSRPIPSIYLITPEFVTIPGTRGWLQFYAEGSFGKLFDDDYKRDRYAIYRVGKSGQAESFLTTDVWFHQKKLHLRTNPDKPIVFYVGFDHASYFGGESYNSSFTGETQSFNPHLKDFFKAFFISGGDGNSPSGDQVFFYGSHLGEECFRLDYQWGGSDSKQKRVGLVFENLFEDGSSIAKFNGMDGLWGIEYHNQQHDAWIQGFVFEYLQTSNQSGPIHWDREDWADSFGEGFGEGRAPGADDYYNNYYYAGHCYYGLALGTPMVKSPVYNADGYLRFTDNRIRAWHLGLEGSLLRANLSRFPRLSRLSRDSRFSRKPTLGYRVLTSYRQSWGTSFVPSSTIRDAFCTMVELNTSLGPWSAKVAYAMDHGDLLGNNQSFNFSISYHGKIL